MSKLIPSPMLSPPGPDPFRYVHSPEVVALLRNLRAALLVTTYQAGKLIVFHANGERLSMLLRSFDRAMGLAVDPARLALATRWQVWTFDNAPGLAGRVPPADTHDACYLPRACHVTGELDIHEIAWGGDELWLVNTLFSCLCTLERPYNFVPRWRPPFVSRLTRQDRCHLNGLALEDGRPRFVTLFAETDTPQGWRPHKRDGGCVIDVPSGEVVARGLSMPHSPRLHEGRLWVLNSGRGQLGVVDRSAGKFEPVVELGGYTRGLALVDRWAFVGLSKIRETATFGGIPIAERTGERMCGVAVVDTAAGKQVGFIEFQGAIGEVFDVQVLPGIINPAVVGLQKETVQTACVVGPERPI